MGLSISRGHQLGGTVPPAPRLSLVPREPEAPKAAPEPAAPAAPPPASADYLLVHDRLNALERLARLHEQGILSGEEFAAEKAVILRLPADELLLDQAAPPTIGQPTVRGPSLVGRLFSWKLIPVGVFTGLIFSYVSQPQETFRFFNEAMRIIGA